MTKTVNGKNGSFDASALFGNFRFPSFDVESIVEMQQKNLEALTQANQLALEGMQALTQRQAEIIRQAIADASGLLGDWTQSSTPEDRVAKSADAAKLAFEKGLAHAHELNELTVKAGTDVFSVLTRRVSQGFDEMRLYAKKQAPAA
jgi:phasin family protein